MERYDNDFMESLKRAFCQTWAYCCYDVHNIVNDPDDAVIQEICIDADRLSTFCLPEDLPAVLKFYDLRLNEQTILGKLIVQNWA